MALPSKKKMHHGDTEDMEKDFGEAREASSLLRASVVHLFSQGFPHFSAPLWRAAPILI
jgi:hypothetical protein